MRKLVACDSNYDKSGKNSRTKKRTDKGIDNGDSKNYENARRKSKSIDL